MGAINCRASTKFAEEIKSEADMATPQSDEHQKAQTLYKSMTSRILNTRDELLQSAQQSFSSGQKNFDSYYAFLLDQLRSSKTVSLCSTVDTTKNMSLQTTVLSTSILKASSSSNNKENVIKQIRRVLKNNHPPSRSNARKPGNSNLYLYVETPTQGFLSRGGKLKQILPSSNKAGKARLCEQRTGEDKYQTCNAADLHKSTFNETQLSTIMKTSKLSFDIISLLPWNVQTLILSFLINQYRRCLCVSAAWHSTLLSSLDTLFNQVENQLVLKSGSFLAFRNSYTESTVCRSGCWKGVRVDRILQLELLPGYEGKSLTVSYTYSFTSDRSTLYMTKYKIDCLPKGNRTMWVHNSENVLTGKKYTYTMNIMPICTGDIVEVAINYYTPRGLIEVSNIEWQEVEVELTPPSDPYLSRDSSLSTSRAEPGKELRCRERQDLNRVCELEMTEAEWYDSNYYKMPEVFCDLKSIATNFTIESIEFASLDKQACKLHLTAYRPGIFRYYKI